MSEGVVFYIKIPRTNTVLKGSMLVFWCGVHQGDGKKMAVGLVGSQLTINSGFLYRSLQQHE
jgi:hypothetical protein